MIFFVFLNWIGLWEMKENSVVLRQRTQSPSTLTWRADIGDAGYMNEND